MNHVDYAGFDPVWFSTTSEDVFAILKGVRYRVVTKRGKKIRLAFRAGTNEVVEAKNLHTGALHSISEFWAGKKKRRQT